MRRILFGTLLLAGASTVAAGQRPARIDSTFLASQPSWYDGYLSSFDRAVATLDLAPLRDTRLARGEREVRVWTQIEIGDPKRMVRVRDVGGRITGEGVFYWGAPLAEPARSEKPPPSNEDIVAYNNAGTCGEIHVRGDMSACRLRYVSAPDWRSILRDAESAGLWTIPDPSTLPSDGIITIDGWTIVVELRTSESYRAYRYNSPETHPKWPSAAQAIKIAETFARADAMLAPPDAQKTYRGVTRGSYRSGLKLCGEQTTLEFADELTSAAKREGIVMPDGTGRAAPEYYVELTGIASPEWLAKRVESKFSRVLNPGRLHAVKLWTGAECGK
ncbi:MAG: hypothetical protein ABIP93_08880 [Gemmatimonadaceae bacterium]